MGTIVAIGGGEIRLSETLAIDATIVELSGKSEPRVLFIPTASGEPDAYIESVKNIYGGRLGCEFESLRILRGDDDEAAVEDKIDSADIIYVGGGNTRMMLEAWREHGVLPRLRDAYAKGTILSGLSAGSVCWFQRAISDSDGFESEEWEYCHVDGMGLLPWCHTPHYDIRKQEAKFRDFVMRNESRAIAIENNCAIVFAGEGYRVVKSDPAARAFLLRGGEDGMGELPIPPEGKIEELTLALA